MAIIQFSYGFYYTVWRTFPAVRAAGTTWVSAVFMAFFLVTVFLCGRQHKISPDTSKDGKGSGARFVIGLDIVYYITMCMINYIEWAENGVLSVAFGIGSFVSIALIVFIQLFFNRSAMYIWLMFLAFSLLGLGILIYDSHVMHLTGSFIYGAGDGLGYIIIYYLCAGAIKQSKSLKMFRLYCFIFFLEYFFISGIFSNAFGKFEGPHHYLAFGVVLVLCSACFLLIPLMQKKVFEADWTDGFYLADMPEHAPVFAQAEKADTEEGLGLSPREREIFALMLKNMPLKTIALELGISFHTVNNHYRAIYRKLGITSKGELFMKYATKTQI
jgi:DNA-binding CsgD family transcriptional regulator